MTCARAQGHPCQCKACYPYTHHGPAVHGSKIADYLVSEIALRQDYPEIFDSDTKEAE